MGTPRTAIWPLELASVVSEPPAAVPGPEAAALTFCDTLSAASFGYRVCPSSAEVGYGARALWQRSLRSSPRAGKPSTWRDPCQLALPPSACPTGWYVHPRVKPFQIYRFHRYQEE